MPRILLAGDANRLVAELTFVRINDLAVVWRQNLGNLVVIGIVG